MGIRAPGHPHPGGRNPLAVRGKIRTFADGAPRRPQAAREPRRKTPHNDEFQRHHTRLLVGQADHRPPPLGPGGERPRTVLPGRCGRGDAATAHPLRGQPAEAARRLHLAPPRRPPLRTLPAALDAGALRPPDRASGLCAGPLRRAARLPPALLRHGPPLRGHLARGAHHGACAALREPHARGVEHPAAAPRADGRLPLPREAPAAQHREAPDCALRPLHRPDCRRQAGRGCPPRLGRADSQCGAHLPPLRAALVRLPLGYQLLGQGRRALSGGGFDVPRGDLRRRGAEAGPRTGPLDHARRRTGGPQGRSPEAHHGHFSTRYKQLDELVAEARTLFPETYAAREGETFTLEKHQ